MPGRVTEIHVAPTEGAPPEPRERVRAVAETGLEGDRYFEEGGTFAGRNGSALTLIEAEALDGVEREYDIALDPGVHRRNLTTEGVALNHLVDRTFSVGAVRCRGVELCEPCSYLERHLEREGVREALVHRGGLRARILSSGEIAVGDDIETDGTGRTEH